MKHAARRHPRRPLLPLLGLAAALAACAALFEPEGPPAKDHVIAVTAANELLRFNAGQPQRISRRMPLKGLELQDSLVGIDYRIARGTLYGLGTSGRLYLIDAELGVAKAVAAAPAVALGVGQIGFDFNPVVDRLRVITSAGLNLRLHPDTGAAFDSDDDAPGVQFDGPLLYGDGEAHAGKTPALAAAAYTYNRENDKLTTNFAIDAERGTLVIQGSRDGAAPVVSPNTGRVLTMGSLGIERFERASFDIADVTGNAYLAAGTATGRTRWYQVDLKTGRARLIGTITGSDVVTGIAIEP